VFKVVGIPKLFIIKLNGETVSENARQEVICDGEDTWVKWLAKAGSN
jgi:hypothetical protein